MDLGAAWNKLADAMHLINSIAGSTPVDSAKIVKAYAMVEDSHGIVQKACARLRTSITPVPQDGEPTMEKEIVAIRNYIASSALFYLEEGKKNRDEKHEMAQWGLSRIQARLRPTITPSPERQEGSDWKAECYKIGAAYVSALITIGALNKFVASSLEKAWDRHGACIFCCRHKSIGHSDICEMARANAEMLKMNSRPPTIPPEIPDNSPAPTAEKAPEVAE